jgi:amidase
VHCRTVVDTARVLDAMKDAEAGYFDPRDPYSALPAGFSPSASYLSVTAASGAKPLEGVRIGVVREYMVKHSANDRAMSDLVNAEIVGVLRDRLGATIVESVDPLYPDDPSIPNMTYTFQRALAEILPFHMPEYLQRRRADGTLVYAVDGFDVTTRDYIVKAAEGLAPLSERLNLRSINVGPPSASFAFDLARYLLRRGDARVKDWATLNANATYHSESRVAAMKNWENRTDLASEGITQNVVMRDVMRMVVETVMRQNRLDVLVNPTTTVPPAKIGDANQPIVNDRPIGRYPTSANAGIPEITVPAGFNRTVFNPRFALTPARTSYATVANEDRPVTVAAPLPVGISFWAGPGDEARILRVAAAYERATTHRRAPAAFGPVGRSGSIRAQQ